LRKREQSGGDPDNVKGDKKGVKGGLIPSIELLDPSAEGNTECRSLDIHENDGTV
jgi:hypothetical protein